MPRRHVLLFILLAVAAGGGCDRETNAPASPPSPKAHAAPVDPATVGSVVGTVRFLGAVPAQTVLQLTAFADCATQHEGPTYAGDILVNDGKLRNVLVSVTEGLDGHTFPAPATPVVIDQVGCLFVPRVVGAQVGQPVRFLNGDPLLHNVHGTPKNSRSWNFPLLTKGMGRTLTIDKPENVIEVKCDVHPWMLAYLGVFEHPFFAVTGDDGRFELKGLPPGQYVIEAWHERFGTRTATVSVAEKATEQIDFTFENK